MKWTPPSERAQFIIFSPIIVPVAVLAAPTFIVMGAIMWLQDRIARRLRPGSEYSPWFAWRPVRMNDWFDPGEGKWVWLERVERRWAGHYVEYRTAPTHSENNQ